MTRDRLVAIRRFFTYGEPCEPEITPQEIDVIFRMAETGVLAEALVRDGSLTVDIESVPAEEPPQG